LLAQGVVDRLNEAIIAKRPANLGGLTVYLPPGGGRVSDDYNGSTFAFCNPDASGTRWAEFLRALPTKPELSSGAPATFVDWDGNSVTIKLTGPGSGNVFCGADKINLISLTGTTEQSKLSLSGKGSKWWGPICDRISVDGALKALDAKTATLLKGVTVSGALGSLALDYLKGTLSIGASLTGESTLTATISLGAAQDLTIDSHIPIKSLTASSWADMDNTADVITAPRIGDIKIKGDFAADLNMTDPAGQVSLGKLTVGGWLDGSDIRCMGSIGSVAVGGMRNTNVFAGVKDDETRGRSGLPLSAREFSSSESMIADVIVKGLSDEVFSCVDSNIAAWNLGRITLQDVELDPLGSNDVFGLAANSLLSYRRRMGRTRAYAWPGRFSPSWPVDDGDPATEFAIIHVL